MEGLMKVLIWRVDHSITDAEFSHIYLEWMKKRSILNCILNTASPDRINEFGFMVELLHYFYSDKERI